MGRDGGASSDGQPVLRVDHVQLGYWTQRGFHLAVADATFDVHAREKVIVIGQSGSGKSTVLKAIAGFLAPTAGTITLAGRPTLEPGPDRAVVFQEFDQLFPWRTVLDNVAYPLRVDRASEPKPSARPAATSSSPTSRTRSTATRTSFRGRDEAARRERARSRSTPPCY